MMDLLHIIKVRLISDFKIIKCTKKTLIDYENSIKSMYLIKQYISSRKWTRSTSEQNRLKLNSPLCQLIIKKQTRQNISSPRCYKCELWSDNLSTSPHYWWNKIEHMSTPFYQHLFSQNNNFFFVKVIEYDNLQLRQSKSNQNHMISDF